MMRQVALSLLVALALALPFASAAGTSQTVAGAWKMGASGQYATVDATATLTLQVRSDGSADPLNWEVATDHGVWKCVNGQSRTGVSSSLLLLPLNADLGACTLHPGNVAVWRAKAGDGFPLTSAVPAVEGRFCPAANPAC